MSALSGEDRYLVPGLVRGLEALKVFTPENPSMTLSPDRARTGGVPLGRLPHRLYAVRNGLPAA